MEMRKVGDVVEVTTEAFGNDYLDEAPVMARYTISSAEIDLIETASGFCQTNNVLEVVIEKSDVEYLFEDDNGDPTVTVDQNGFRLDSSRMIVNEWTVRFVAHEKYTGLEVWVESVRISDIKKAAMKGSACHEISD